MTIPFNQDIAGRLDEIAQLLGEQGVNRFRVQAYHRTAHAVRALSEPVSAVFARHGLAGLEALPDIGPITARAIRELLLHGQLAMLDRLRGEHDPVIILRSVPGVGKTVARLLHEKLGIHTLGDLEAAAHDGRLARAGIGTKRLAGICDSLANRLRRLRPAGTDDPARSPPVAEILDVDREYRSAASADRLRKVAPRRFNPTREAWLPVLHTSRGPRHYTALFSNTARAHELHKTRDWVVVFSNGSAVGSSATVVTARSGALKGRCVVRGREAECEVYYRTAAPPGAADATPPTGSVPLS